MSDISTGLRVTLGCAAAVVLLGGCTSSPQPGTPTPTTGSTASTASPSIATTTPTASLSPEETAVRKLIGETLYETQDAVAAGTAELDALHQVMTLPLVNERLDLYAKYRNRGYKQTGRISSEVRSVIAVSSGKYTAQACLDTSQIAMVDKTGAQLPGGGPTRLLHKYDVINDRGAFKASSDTVVETTC